VIGQRFFPERSAALSLPALVLVLGCVGTPTPLAPSFAGSIGVPHGGAQTRAVELPRRGEGFVRYRGNSPHYWGNARLVQALQTAAAAVSRQMPGGAPLIIGDLSARYGGKIPGHRSHRTGRDADLLFYVTTPAGASVPSPGFFHIESDGLAALEGKSKSDFVRLDVERQWLLIKTLISSEHAAVQFMFVSRAVEALLIDYARSRGEPLELTWRAETVMLEPLDSTPHDDHIHLRIACTPEESVFGCDGGGPYWEWLPALPALSPLGEAELTEIGRDDPFDLDDVATAEAPIASGDGV
jgi:penicillin-insensitive murein endopeptidase